MSNIISFVTVASLAVGTAVYAEAAQESASQDVVDSVMRKTIEKLCSMPEINLCMSISYAQCMSEIPRIADSFKAAYFQALPDYLSLDYSKDVTAEDPMQYAKAARVATICMNQDCFNSQRYKDSEKGAVSKCIGYSNKSLYQTAAHNAPAS